MRAMAKTAKQVKQPTSNKDISNNTGRAESKLIHLYRTNSTDLNTEFRENITDSQLNTELIFIKDLFESEEHDINLLYFGIQQVMLVCESFYKNMKTSNISNISNISNVGVENAITLILKILDKKTYTKNIEFRLQVLDSLVNIDTYTPVLIYALDTLDLAFSLNDPSNLNNNNSNNKKKEKGSHRTRGVKIDASVLSSTSYQLSCIERLCGIIKRILNKYRGVSVCGRFGCIVRERVLR